MLRRIRKEDHPRRRMAGDLDQGPLEIGQERPYLAPAVVRGRVADEDPCRVSAVRIPTVRVYNPACNDQ
jgi:hypothetical protein